MTVMMINGEDVEIDDLCVPFILFFNRNGLKTQFCCEGHGICDDFYILFDDSVTDETILSFQKKYWNALENDLPFSKWTRIVLKNDLVFNNEEELNRTLNSSYDEKTHDIFSNWQFVIGSNMFENGRCRREYLENLYNKLIRIERLTKK